MCRLWRWGLLDDEGIGSAGAVFHVGNLGAIAGDDDDIQHRFLLYVGDIQVYLQLQAFALLILRKYQIFLPDGYRQPIDVAEDGELGAGGTPNLLLHLHRLARLKGDGAVFLLTVDGCAVSGLFQQILGRPTFYILR